MNLAVSAATDAWVPLPAMVQAAEPELDGVATLELEVETGAVSPGQFAMLYAFGVGEAAISFSGIGEDGRLQHTVRHAGAISAALAALQAGETLGWRGPFGHGWPMAEIAGRDLVVMAGGLGLAPLRPVLARAHKAPGAARRSILLYGARHPDTLLYRAQFNAWQAEGTEVHVTVDHAAADWAGHVGLVTALLPRAQFDPAETVAFLCGPEVMMRFSACALVDAGVPEERIWLSLERNMKCAIGHCGHCQFGADFVCKDGPVFRFDKIRPRLFTREL